MVTGRKPRFCKGACRTAHHRAAELDKLAEGNPFLVKTFAGLKGADHPEDGFRGGADLSPGYFIREGRRAALARRVKEDERAQRRSK